MTEEEINQRIPVVTHDALGAECGGYLAVRLRGENSEIVCNECGASIQPVRTSDVELVMTELAMGNAMRFAMCPNCGAANAFPGSPEVQAFVCRHCKFDVNLAGKGE